MSVRRRIDTLLSRLEEAFETNNRIEISRSAILHNFDMFTDLTGKHIIPVLKSNAYGHGLEQVATILKERVFPYIAVDGYFEALRIREVSKQPVLIMGMIKPENFERMKFEKFAFVVHDAATIHALGKTDKHIKVHLEINSGMNRYGAKLADVPRLTRLILSYKNLKLEGIMSHLADSDGTSDETVKDAVSCFDSAVEIVRELGAHPLLLHVAQSAGSVRAKSKYANAIRLGVGLYGINPLPVQHKSHKRLRAAKPALRLVSTITKVIDLEKGDKVSYNYTFTAPSAMRLAVLPIGYYEGVNRKLSNSGSVKFGTSQLPIVGRVCMNHTMVDITGSKARLGDEVIVYSDNARDQNAIDIIGSTYGLFNYNILTALSSDVRRIIVQ